MTSQMSTAWFRFYEELNDFLPKARNKVSFRVEFTGTPAIKDLVESLGVPHAEIDMILVNSKSVDFRYKMKDGDQVSVYPVFESIDISGITHLRAEPLREPRFVLDVHLGKLARYLRLLGFDTLYDPGYDDNLIINISVTQNRIILTHDKGILKNRNVTRGHWVRSQDPEVQVSEIVRRFDLKGNSRPFTRCIECNTPLIVTGKDNVEKFLLPLTKKHFDEFRKCEGCGRIYWEGSHYENMKEFVRKILYEENKDYI